MGTDFRKQGRNSPAPSAYNGDSKRGRTGTTMLQTSSLPTSPSGSLSRFDSQPWADLSSIIAPDLLWVRDCSSEPIVYPDSADGPFIVLMESTFPGRNCGRLDSPIASATIWPLGFIRFSGMNMRSCALDSGTTVASLRPRLLLVSGVSRGHLAWWIAGFVVSLLLLLGASLPDRFLGMLLPDHVLLSRSLILLLFFLFFLRGLDLFFRL